MSNLQAGVLALAIVAGGFLAGGRYEAVGVNRMLDRWTGSVRLMDPSHLNADAAEIRRAAAKPQAPSGSSMSLEEALKDLEAAPAKKKPVTFEEALESIGK